MRILSLLVFVLAGGAAAYAAQSQSASKPAAKSPPPAPMLRKIPPAPPSSAALVKLGQGLYSHNCVACHGDRADGKGTAATLMNPRPTDLVHGPYKRGAQLTDIFRTLAYGVPGSPMPSLKKLSDQDRWGLSYYLLSVQAKPRPRAARPRPAQKPAAK